MCRNMGVSKYWVYRCRNIGLSKHWAVRILSAPRIHVIVHALIHASMFWLLFGQLSVSHVQSTHIDKMFMTLIHIITTNNIAAYSSLILAGCVFRLCLFPIYKMLLAIDSALVKHIRP